MSLECLKCQALEERVNAIAFPSLVNTSVQECVADGEHFGWIVDGWEMANSQHVEGVICRCGLRSFLLNALEGLDAHHALSIAKQWEDNVVGADVIAPDDANDFQGH